MNRVSRPNGIISKTNLEQSTDFRPESKRSPVFDDMVNYLDIFLTQMYVRQQCLCTYQDFKKEHIA